MHAACMVSTCMRHAWCACVHLYLHAHAKMARSTWCRVPAMCACIARGALPSYTTPTLTLDAPIRIFFCHWNNHCHLCTSICVDIVQLPHVCISCYLQMSGVLWTHPGTVIGFATQTAAVGRAALTGHTTRALAISILAPTTMELQHCNLHLPFRQVRVDWNSHNGICIEMIA